MFYVYIVLFLVFVIAAIFNKKKWARSILAFNTGTVFVLYGILGEITFPHETVQWLHIIWGVINILIGLICFLLGAHSIMRLYKKTEEDRALSDQPPPPPDIKGAKE
ncbi:MAG TPA: hypothetical protein DCZ94_10740 [Lentisphaeria bacterium]|nr:MAG: hypothetical protein A2X48_06620 [Lentisphaerae bacterium GWF2_49_21]HBC87421.1 hypothetical protein [Lentisphaeria bacterium]